MKRRSFRIPFSFALPSKARLVVEALEERDLLSANPIWVLCGPPTPDMDEVLYLNSGERVFLDSSSVAGTYDPIEFSQVIGKTIAEARSNALTLVPLSEVVLEGDEDFDGSTTYVPTRTVGPIKLDLGNTPQDEEASSFVFLGLSEEEEIERIIKLITRSGGAPVCNLDMSTSLTSNSGVDANPAAAPHKLLERFSVSSSGFDPDSQSLDYLKLTLSDLPDTYRVPVVLSGTAVYGQDYRIYKHMTSGYVEQAVYNSEFTYEGASGGSTEYYIVPIDNSNVSPFDKSVTFSFDTSRLESTSGGSIPTPTLGTVSVTVSIIDDDVEFVSDVDYDNNGNLPTIATGAVANNDRYDAYIFYDPDVNIVSQDQLHFLAPVNAIALHSDNVHPIVYSIISGNENGYFEIDSSTGVVSLSTIYEHLSVDTVPSQSVLTVRATYSDVGGTVWDDAVVTIKRVAFAIDPYTPDTFYIPPKKIPTNNWKTIGVGIRRNTDYDMGATIPDSSLTSYQDNDNDFLRVGFDIYSGAGLEYELQKGSDSNNLRVWANPNKSQPMVDFVDGASALSSYSNMWLEYASSGNDVYSLTLVVKNAYTHDTIFSETATFKPFNGVTCAFVGELQTPGDDESSSGINKWVVDRLLAGYDVHVWDDGYDPLEFEHDCFTNGEGRALDEIANAVNNRGVSSVSVVGYSHGGGSVYNLTYRMYYDGQTPPGKSSPFSDVITGNYTLSYTSYVDAVENSSSLDSDPEIRRPLGSAFHLNQFEKNTWVHGDATIGVAPDTLNLPEYDSLTHYTIEDDDSVLLALKSYHYIHAQR